MDNYIEILIYLLIIVGSGLIQAFRNKKKGRQQPTDTPPPPRRRREVSSPEADTTTQRPTSFEDILRELMGGPQPTPPEPEPYQPPVRTQRTWEEKESEVYQTTSDTYQKAVQEAGHAEKLNDRIDLEKLDDFIKPKYNSSRQKTKTSKFTREVKAMLRHPESARKAVMLSEILNRKHF